MELDVIRGAREKTWGWRQHMKLKLQGLVLYVAYCSRGSVERNTNIMGDKNEVAKIKG